MKHKPSFAKQVRAEQIEGDHYKKLAIQPNDYSQLNRLGTLESNVVKYVTRHKFKGGANDIKKAIHDLQWILATEYNPEFKPEDVINREALQTQHARTEEETG